MQERLCKYYLNCEFYQKYNTEMNLMDKIMLFHQYIELYCFGTLEIDCYLYTQREETGSPPADNITPAGVNFLSGV